MIVVVEVAAAAGAAHGSRRVRATRVWAAMFSLRLCGPAPLRLGVSRHPRACERPQKAPSNATHSRTRARCVTSSKQAQALRYSATHPSRCASPAPAARRSPPAPWGAPLCRRPRRLSVCACVQLCVCWLDGCLVCFCEFMCGMCVWLGVCGVCERPQPAAKRRPPRHKRTATHSVHGHQQSRIGTTRQLLSNSLATAA